jgi:HSP20 family protein
MLSFPEVNELSDDVRRVFEELDRLHVSATAVTSVYTPALDVLETAASIEVLVDLPGVVAGDLRVLIKNGALIIAGEKLGPDRCSQDCAAFHLVERGFGRFARVIRLSVAIDAGRATASLRAGELRVSIPRITERRGEEIVVRVEQPPA